MSENKNIRRQNITESEIAEIGVRKVEIGPRQDKTRYPPIRAKRKPGDRTGIAKPKAIGAWRRSGVDIQEG